MAEGGDEGKWIQKQLLGQGAFGCITLWQNEKTEEKIAIKTCRHKDDLPDKTSDRWRMEVYIMSRLNHDNVIRSVKLPQQLMPRSGELPILAMEYCEGGDLRKVLNRPENCFGLKESEILQLVSGVGSAIEYLHSNRIIHRDLKPENIVLKPLDPNKILYKVIDLGYAKELDVNSICNSYVGTMQYLAPELFVSKPYTKTVDYWSFGSLVFECIAGFRPFLPTLPPVEWHNVVCKKSPDDINATYDENKEIKFSKKLPNNRLCKVLQDYFEQWLRLMLRWDPKARGGGIINIKGIERPKCFCLLEIFTELKLIRILYVEMNTVLSFPINETHTIQEVQKAISVELNIPPEQQLILLANGTKLEPNNFALDGWNDHASEDIIVFLFRLAPLQLPPKHGKKLPPQVQAIAKEPMTLLPTKDHRKAWAQAVYWCTDVNQDYKRLVIAHRAALLNLMKNMASLNKLKFQLSSEIGKLMSCTDLFKASLEFDLLKYQETFKGKPITQDIYHNWSLMADTINNYIHLRKRVEDLEEKVQRFVSEFNEIQKKPTTGTELEEYEMKSKGLYGKLLQVTPGNGSYEMMNHQSMVDLIGRCFMKRDELTKILYKHLSTILELLERLEPLYPEMETASKEIQAASEQLKSMQCRRQGDLWALLACQSYPTNGESTLVPSGMTHTNTSMHICQSFESLQLMDDSKNYTQRLQELLETVVKEQDESLKYLSSLNSNS
ncbi:inhibitor of nuclear factor kappa-B kinase subunit alpha-like [Biomphalaria glabrata]|uniref:IkappaB kinase n=3 Tax=Biomphalaria glabrata TaxID=6526 RepID=A0A9W2ZSI7_BIOGL|nr:inhibitor of nuclear factor kappa-B kinase subunit alpha-like [Biomphalaria glabrata]